MLTALRITDFATLEEAELALGPGLTVLTGETGAGKSLLVDALGLLLGGRGDPGFVRAGADEASIEGSFAKSPELARRLAALGIPDLGDEVSVRRTVHRTGRGKVHVNGALVTVGVLAQLLHGLFDIAGQLDQVSLFSPGEHRSLLDRAGKLEKERIAYDTAYGKLRAVEARLAALGGDDAEARGRADFLAFQLSELDQLAPVTGEETALEAERRKLGDAGKLERAARSCESVLMAEEGSALERVERARATLREAKTSDAVLAPFLDRLDALSAELEDVTRGLIRYGRSVEVHPDRLEEIDGRLTLYRRLGRKHVADSAGLVAKREALAAEVDRLAHREELRTALEKEREVALHAARAVAVALGEARVKAAARLSRAVTDTLASLAMPKARFEIQVRPADALGPEGGDEVCFLFGANAGEPPKPLAKVASGGEASRLLLALRRQLMTSDVGMGCVLDEADAGVSGAVADVVGRQMREVSEVRQVLCITHLPQVAAYGDAHWVVEKREEGGRTRSRIRLLEKGEPRLREVARMLSGQEVTREALAAAHALVRIAINSRQLPCPPRGRHVGSARVETRGSSGVRSEEGGVRRPHGRRPQAPPQ